MKKIVLWLIAVLYVSQTGFAQKFNDNKTREIVEPILNTILNSEVFDSVYRSNQVYFLINDLIPCNNTWKLHKKYHNVKYINKEQLKKVKQYFVLGDFTLDWNSPKKSSVRVQVILMPENTLMNFRLKYIDEKWIIENYAILFDDYL
jgi:hypothetical protein